MTARRQGRGHIGRQTRTWGCGCSRTEAVSTPDGYLDTNGVYKADGDDDDKDAYAQEIIDQCLPHTFAHRKVCFLRCTYLEIWIHTKRCHTIEPQGVAVSFDGTSRANPVSHSRFTEAPLSNSTGDVTL